MRTERRRSARRVLGVLLAGLALGVVEEAEPLLQEHRVAELLLPGTAHAQYGTSRRVARRTSRRTASRQEYYGHGGTGVYAGVGGVAAMPVGAAYVTALPGGCAATVVGAVTYHHCGSVYYRPYYQGTTLVYVQEAPP